MEGISWADRISLFRYALLAAGAAGVVCPLVGALLWLRRTSFSDLNISSLWLRFSVASSPARMLWRSSSGTCAR